MTHEDITPEQEAAERTRPTGRTRLTRLIVMVLILFAWFGLAGVGGPLVGRLSEVQKNDNASFLPKSAESTEVGKLAARFSSTDALPYFVVIERAAGLKPSDSAAVSDFIAGLAVTGGVITSAGIVLASTFSALSIIPLVFLVQIAFIVAFGVLLDTLVVRSLLVPAFAYELGRRIWWPSRLGQQVSPADGDNRDVFMSAVST